MEVLSTITVVFGALKKIQDAVELSKSAEAKLALAEMQSALADLKIETAELKVENLRLQDEILAMKKSADVRAKVVYRDGFCFLAQPEVGLPVGPYCTRCVQVDGRLVSLRQLFGPLAMLGSHTCPQCKSNFGACP